MKHTCVLVRVVGRDGDWRPGPRRVTSARTFGPCCGAGACPTLMSHVAVVVKRVLSPACSVDVATAGNAINVGKLRRAGSRVERHDASSFRR